MRILFVCACLFYAISTSSQVTTFSFKRLGTDQGLSDGLIHSFVQDRYGYIWIGTTYGLNRFDGINVKTFVLKSGDSTSLINNYVSSLYCDRNNDLWVGTMGGLCRYDYRKNELQRYASPEVFTVTDIKEDKHGTLWLGTTRGLRTVNKQRAAVERFPSTNNPDLAKKLNCIIYQIEESANGNWYMATTQGIKIFNPFTGSFAEIKHDSSKTLSLSSDYVYSVSFDRTGNLWAVCTGAKSVLNRIDLKAQKIKYYNRFTEPKKKWNTNTITRVLTDNKGRVWVISGASGLSLYDSSKDDFIDFMNNPYIQNSLVSNNNGAIYQDRDGIIWVGSAGYGISYFNPDKNLFSSIYPLMKTGDAITDTWCRAVCEDKEGNLWLGTGKGIMKYDHNWQNFKLFTNEDDKKLVIHYNSIRSLLLDDQGDIWIGTARGVNRYRTSNGHMDFFDQKQGVPLAFFWMMAKDNQGAIWLGSASGLYKYDRENNRFDDLSKDSLLSRYAHRNVQALFADSRNRLFIGLLDVGLVMYDIDARKTKLLTIKDSLISDTRFSSFAEDKDGIIWIGSEQRLAAYDPVKNASRFYSKEDGLASDRTNNIMVDSRNRVWIGTSNGLCMISRDRRKIKRFDVNDGLLTNQFNEQAAYRTKNGLFIYPTYKGYVVFRPEDYREKASNVPVYLTSFKISSKEITTNPEALQKIDLQYRQNFFTITLAGLSYMNASQCLYAYKMEPFDKDWILTQNPEINYTNVPAGNYMFKYKVIVEDPDWNLPAKTLRLSVAEIFYKRWWFKWSLVMVIIAAIISFYRYRLKQQRRIILLQNKAQLLEKEKTVVQFENLKQQLNPHFLFNSLTSLRSLIRVDPKTATHFLDGLSKTYRYILKSGDSELVMVREELSFIVTFTDLQKTRFKEGLDIRINVDPSHYDRYIVPVTLQNLIENAIKHNTADEEKPLFINIYSENDYIVVQNSLQRYRIVESSNKRGLASMKSLYNYLSSKPMIITEDDKYFLVKIPLI
jgi:ligand-binding sensor domain-containing protein